MTPEYGVLSAKVMTLAEICSGALPIGQKGRWYEFGIRWAEGEIADDVLVLETDGYCEVDDTIAYEGRTYGLEFGEDLLGDALRHSARNAEVGRLGATVALRYCVEFDAFLEPEQARTGGKWNWSGGRGREKQRQPEEFLAVWCR